MVKRENGGAGCPRGRIDEAGVDVGGVLEEMEDETGENFWGVVVEVADEEVVTLTDESVTDIGGWIVGPEAKGVRPEAIAGQRAAGKGGEMSALG